MEQKVVNSHKVTCQGAQENLIPKEAVIILVFNNGRVRPACCDHFDLNGENCHAAITDQDLPDKCKWFD